jgi:peptidyl-prolyl cis-trans isomerase C
VTSLVKTLRTAPFALLAMVLALAVIGSSCSATNPVALQVGDWQLSNSDFQDVLTGWAEVSEANGAGTEADFHPNPGSWSTDYTSFLLNQLATSELSVQAAERKGIEITQDDLDAAEATLAGSFSSAQGSSYFAELPDIYQDAVVSGVAAQQLLAEQLLEKGTTDEALRAVFDASDQYSQEQACVSHILILAGEPDGQTTPSDADYASALAEIEAVQAELEGAANFAEVATASSQDGSATSGGDLGCAPEGSYVPGFEEAVWSQAVGDVGGPVQSIYGYHLVLVRSRGVPTFEDVKDQLAAGVEGSVQDLLSIELVSVAADVGVTVDGRFGDFDEATAQIVAPAGPLQPSTTVSGLDQLLDSGLQ